MTLAPATAAPPGAAEGGAAGQRRATALPGRGRPSFPAWVRTLIWVPAALSGLAIWLLVYAFSLSGFQEAGAQKAMYADLRSEIAQGIAPLGGDVKPGRPVALLRVPQAGISAVVVEGTTSGILEQGPGLEADTPLPGQPGVSVIYGRQTMFGGPFRHLEVLQPGDVFAVTTGEGTFGFRVMDLRYPGDRLPSPLPAGGSRIVLVTATGSGWRGAGTPDRLLYVDASLIGSPAGAAPAALAGSPPDSQLPMRGDTGAMIPLVLWLQALLLTVLAVVWVRSRWGDWQTWLVAAPVLLAVVWAGSESAFQLLPNLM